MSPAQIVLAILLAIAVLYTVFGYPHRYGALTGRSRLYRTVGLFLLSLLLLLVFMSTCIDFYAGVDVKIGALRKMFYWASCLLLGLILPAVALLDTLESLVAVRREKRDYLMGMWQEEQERLHQNRATTGTGVSSIDRESTREPTRTNEQQSNEQQNKRGG